MAIGCYVAPMQRVRLLFFACACAPFVLALACGSEVTTAHVTDGTTPSPSSSAGDPGATGPAPTSATPTPAPTSADAGKHSSGPTPPSTVDAGPTHPPSAHACTTPWPGGPSTFNPDCVYLLGTLSEGAAYLDAIIHPSKPNEIHAGFGLDTSGGAIRPTDGRLFFDDSDEIYVFSDDAYVYAKDNFGNPNYPASSLANDTLVSTPACTSGWPAWINGFFPDDGAAFYSCGGSPVYLEGSSAALPMAGYVLAPAPGRAALITKGYGQLSVQLSSGQELAVAPLPMFQGAIARFVDGHFVVALIKGPSSAEMRTIALDGTTTYVGEYGIGAGPSPKWAGAKLEGDGSVVAFTLDTATGVDRIERYRVGTPRTVVYDETGKKVKIHISQLVTGS